MSLHIWDNPHSEKPTMNSTNFDSIQNIARNTITGGQFMIEYALVLSLLAIMTIVQGTVAVQVVEYLTQGS